MNLIEMTMPVLDPSSPGNAAHPLRRGKLAALATLAPLGGTGCVAEVHTRTVTPAPATVTYQEFAVVEEPVVHIAEGPVHIETYPHVVYRGTPTGESRPEDRRRPRARRGADPPRAARRYCSAPTSSRKSL
ncbi:hypothetical protein [Sorangium sp. So ce388]|uniref:hypothetical protein n=1 Tax=Sorangium sp. So ce388 TaxID=3133309 RepID=UPI003F5B2FF7